MKNSMTVSTWLLVAAVALATFRVATAAEPTGQDLAVAAGGRLLGSPAPRLQLKTIDGETINLGDLYGKQAVYLKFWATWCVPCREQMPHLRSVFESSGPDLAVIAIDSGFNDSLEDVQKARSELGLKMPIVLDDGEAGEAFRLRVTPQHIVIGRDGRVLYVGHLADERLDAALLAARNGASADAPIQPVASTARLRTYGVGDRLPELATTTLDGSVFRAREPGNERATVLVFMSPWCESYLATSRPARAESCRQVREQVDALAKADDRFRWLGIASSLWATQKDLSEYAAEHKPSIPLALDESGEWFRSFRVLNVPTVLIVNADGQIVSRVDGFDAGLPTLLRSASGM